MLLIETDDHLVADEYDWNAHLAALLYHFLALLDVSCNVVFRVLDIVRLKKLLAHLAKMAGRGGVNSYGLLFHKSVLGLGVAKLYHNPSGDNVTPFLLV